MMPLQREMLSFRADKELKNELNKAAHEVFNGNDSEFIKACLIWGIHASKTGEGRDELLKYSDELKGRRFLSEERQGAMPFSIVIASTVALFALIALLKFLTGF